MGLVVVKAESRVTENVVSDQFLPEARVLPPQTAAERVRQRAIEILYEFSVETHQILLREQRVIASMPSEIAPIPFPRILIAGRTSREIALDIISAERRFERLYRNLAILRYNAPR